MPDRDLGWRRRGTPLVIGHRGSSAHATENTVEAFRRARADGADGVELDVLLCKTGEPVVFHDDDLVRLAGRPERVADLPLAALREVELIPGGRISTLDEVIEAAGGLLLNIELKSPPRVTRELPLVKQVVAVVKRHAAAQRVLLSSFNPAILTACKTVAPALPRGMLFHRFLSRPLREVWLARAVAPLALHPEQSLIDADRLAKWRQAGYLIVAWTVDDFANLTRLKALGVDAVIGNDPGHARTVLKC